MPARDPLRLTYPPLPLSAVGSKEGQVLLDDLARLDNTATVVGVAGLRSMVEAGETPQGRGLAAYDGG